MVVENRQRPRKRLAPGQIPDPLRAHGAWVYLAVSILAGMLAAGDRGPLPAFFAGTVFLGVFVLVGSQAAVGRGVAVARLALGLLLVVGSLALGLRFGADRVFLFVGLLGVPPVLAAALLAWRNGFMSPSALGWGVTALAVAAPAAASAGGASLWVAAVILAILAPFFFWRTWRLARALGPGWTRERFARQGLIESALAVVWGALAVVAARLAQL